MKLRIKKFQEGGVMPEDQVEEVPVGQEQAAPQEQDPMMQMMQMAAQALQNNDCQAAMQVCDMLLQLLQEAQAQQQKMTPENSAPVYKKGGILVKRIKK